MSCDKSESEFLDDLLSDDPQISNTLDAQHWIKKGNTAIGIRECLEFFNLDWQYDGEFHTYYKFSNPPFQDVVRISFQGPINHSRIRMAFRDPVPWDGDVGRARKLVAVITAEERRVFDLHDKEGLHALMTYVASLKKSLSSPTGTIRLPKMSDESLLNQLNNGGYCSPYFIEAREDIRTGCLLDAVLNFTKPFCLGSYRPLERQDNVEFKQRGLRSISLQRLDRISNCNSQIPTYSTLVILRGIGKEEKTFGDRAREQNAVIEYMRDENSPLDRLDNSDIVFDLALQDSIFNLMKSLLTHRDMREQARRSARTAHVKPLPSTAASNMFKSAITVQQKPHGVVKPKAKGKRRPLARRAVLNQANKAPTREMSFTHKNIIADGENG